MSEVTEQRKVWHTSKWRRMSDRIYRVDKFIVPRKAREEFIVRVRSAHKVLRTLPGFLQDFVLEQLSGPGEFNVVTIVEWDRAESMENAKAAVARRYKEMNFNPQEFIERSGIKTDIGEYKRIDS